MFHLTGCTKYIEELSIICDDKEEAMKIFNFFKLLIIANDGYIVLIDLQEKKVVEEYSYPQVLS